MSYLYLIFNAQQANVTTDKKHTHTGENMSHTFEIAPFKTKSNIALSEVLEKAQYVQENFIEKQAGFISRNLVKNQIMNLQIF